MIVAQRKTIPDLLAIVEKHRKLVVLGCGTCVTVCLSGGQREVSIIASALRMAAKLKGLPLEVDEGTIERQCDNVFLEQAADTIKNHDAVLSLGCHVHPTVVRFTGGNVGLGVGPLDVALFRGVFERGLADHGGLDEVIGVVRVVQTDCHVSVPGDDDDRRLHAQCLNGRGIKQSQFDAVAAIGIQHLAGQSNTLRRP